MRMVAGMRMAGMRTDEMSETPKLAWDAPRHAGSTLGRTNETKHEEVVE